MKISNILTKNFLLIAILLIATFSFSIIQTSCGGSSTTSSSDDDDDTDDSTGDDDDDDDDSSSDCSTDGSAALVPGTYTFTLNTGRTQVKIFVSDCNKCFETMDEDETDLTVDGTWSSTLGDLDDDGQEIDIVVGSVTYVLSGDGLTLSEGDSVWGKRTSSSYTCTE
jgi:hypothetical protein